MGRVININIKDIPEQTGVKLIELNGELDTFTSQKLISEVLPLIEQGTPNLIADLSGLSYINSTGIYNLLHCYTKAKEKGGYVKLVAVNDNIKEILDMIGVTKLLTPYPTLQDALVGLR